MAEQQQEGIQAVLEASHLEAADGGRARDQAQRQDEFSECLSSFLQSKPGGCVWRTNTKNVLILSCPCMPWECTTWKQMTLPLTPALASRWNLAKTVIFRLKGKSSMWLEKNESLQLCLSEVNVRDRLHSYMLLDFFSTPFGRATSSGCFSKA